MTLQELIELQEHNELPLLIFLLAVPILAIIIGLSTGKKADQSPAKYLFSLLVYATSIPGMMALAACVHLIFVAKGDFFEANLLIYVLPIVTMATTLSIIRRFVPLEKVPGFGRISGLLMVCGIVGLVVFFLNRAFFGIIFFGNIWMLMGIFAVMVLILVIGGQMLFGRKEKS